MKFRGIVILATALTAVSPAAAQKFRHVGNTQKTSDSVAAHQAEAPEIRAKSVAELLDSLPPAAENPFLRYRLAGPNGVTGYRSVAKPDFSAAPLAFTPEERRRLLRPDSIAIPDYPVVPDAALTRAAAQFEAVNDFLYEYFLIHPWDVDFLAWKLPKPAKLRKGEIPVTKDAAKILTGGPESVAADGLFVYGRRHWLHKAGASLQFSQAYISPNWYQGGNNNLTLIVDGLWNVKLNEVFHPTLMFESNIQYKLGLYSTPQDQYHKYSISEDLFQWNMKAGIRAFRKKWFYTLTVQFKTQLLHSYGKDSQVRKASFMSPGDLNIGLGMSYQTANERKTARFAASLSPISYNLKTCLDTEVSPTQFNIPEGKTTWSEIGSSAEVTFNWDITGNISYSTRLFAFTNYKYFQADWENTLSFRINRFLSTQIYVRPRFDSSTEIVEGSWRHWMIKEIFSFGFEYHFSTKQ